MPRKELWIGIARPLIDLAVDVAGTYSRPGGQGARERPSMGEPRSVEDYEREVEDLYQHPMPASEDLDYCLECFVKHLGGSSKLLDEAIDFYRADGGMTERLKEKVRAVNDELAGMKDDVSADSPEEVKAIYDRSRQIRKKIWNKKLSRGGGSEADLAEVKAEVDEQLRRTYEVAEREEERQLERVTRTCDEWGLGRECKLLLRRVARGELKPDEFKGRFEDKYGGKGFTVEFDERNIKIKRK